MILTVKTKEKFLEVRKELGLEISDLVLDEFKRNTRMFVSYSTCGSIMAIVTVTEANNTLLRFIPDRISGKGLIYISSLHSKGDRHGIRLLNHINDVFGDSKTQLLHAEEKLHGYYNKLGFKTGLFKRRDVNFMVKL